MHMSVPVDWRASQSKRTDLYLLFPYYRTSPYLAHKNPLSLFPSVIIIPVHYAYHSSHSRSQCLIFESIAATAP